MIRREGNIMKELLMVAHLLAVISNLEAINSLEVY
jgi:hypothetical protein